jgi:hypothetical protein
MKVTVQIEYDEYELDKVKNLIQYIQSNADTPNVAVISESNLERTTIDLAKALAINLDLVYQDAKVLALAIELADDNGFVTRQTLMYAYGYEVRIEVKNSLASLANKGYMCNTYRGTWQLTGKHSRMIKRA